MRVLICGSRTFSDRATITDAVRRLAIKHNFDVHVIQGGARGADTLAKEVALALKIPYTEFRADWSLGRRAGYVRNQQMLDEGKPDLVLAFRSAGESRGTDMIVDLARRKAGVPTFVYQA